VKSRTPHELVAVTNALNEARNDFSIDSFRTAQHFQCFMAAGDRADRPADISGVSELRRANLLVRFARSTFDTVRAQICSGLAMRRPFV
jgi:hypothetical protein